MPLTILHHQQYDIHCYSFVLLSHIYSEYLGSLPIKTPGFPGGPAGKESICNAGDIRDKGSIPGSRRSPGEGQGNPLQ